MHPLPLGASGGIGRACTVAFLAAGDRVIGTFARRPQALDEWSEHPRFEARALDMHAAEQVHGLASELDETGGLDALVLTPGAIQRGRVETLEVSEVAAVWRDNVEGPWRVWSALRPALRARRVSRCYITASALQAVPSRQARQWTTPSARAEDSRSKECYCRTQRRATSRQSATDKPYKFRA
mgnify:CR=1 FL=1